MFVKTWKLSSKTWWTKLSLVEMITKLKVAKTTTKKFHFLVFEMKILKGFLKYDLRSPNGLKIVPIRAVQIFWPPWHFRKYSGSKSSSIWNSKQNTEVLRIIIDVSYKVADKLDFTSNPNCEFYIFLPRFLFTFFFASTVVVLLWEVKLKG